MVAALSNYELAKFHDAYSDHIFTSESSWQVHACTSEDERKADAILEIVE